MANKGFGEMCILNAVDANDSVVTREFAYVPNGVSAEVLPANFEQLTSEEQPIVVTRSQLADIISTAVVAATGAQAKKGATPENVRQATHAALGVSQQVSGPEPLES